MPEKKHRILFVDDESAITRPLKLALRKQPWEIVTADSGEEALERVSESPFDVVVSDERMPGLQGSDFLSIVRKDHPETVRIILSGQANVPAAVKAINSAEIYRFLLKPCPAEEIALTIHEALNQRDERRNFEAWRGRQCGPDRAELEANFNDWIGSLWIGFQPIETHRRFSSGLRAREPVLRCLRFRSAEMWAMRLRRGRRTSREQ